MDFSLNVRITGGRMAIVLGAAVAITAISACIAPLLQSQDDREDDSNDIEVPKQQKQSNASIQNSQSFYSIFMNGLQKIGIVVPPENSTSDEEHPKLSKILEIPKITTSDASTSPMPQTKFSENHQKCIQCNFSEIPGEMNKFKPSFNIQVILSQSSGFTQIEENYFSVEETTRSSGKSPTGEIMNHKNSESLIAINSHNSSIEDKGDACQENAKAVVSFNCKNSSSEKKTNTSQENLEAIVSFHSPHRKGLSDHLEELPESVSDKVPRILKPKRAHLPKTFPVVVDVHQNASIENPNKKQNFVIRQATVATRFDDFEMKPTPPGIFQVNPPNWTELNRNSSLEESQGFQPGFASPPGLRPNCASTCPLSHKSKFSFSPSRYKKSDNNPSNSASSLVESLRKWYSRFLSPGKRKTSNFSKNTVIRNRPTGVIRDLELERERMLNEKRESNYSASEVVSSTKIENTSSPIETRSVQKEPLNGTRPRNNDISRKFDDELSKCKEELKKNTNQLVKDTDAFLNVARSHRNNYSQSQVNIPTKTTSSLPSKNNNNFASGISHSLRISESGTDYPLLPGEKKGISSSFRNFFHRGERKKKRRSLVECNLSFEKIPNLNGRQQLRCTEP